MATSGQDLSSIAHQFPQPSRPLGADYTNIQPMVPENSFSYRCFDGFNDLEQNWTTKSAGKNHEYNDLRQIFRGSVDKLDEKGFEKFKKLASKVEKKVPIERLFKETLHDFGGRPASEAYEKFVRKLNSGETKDRDVNMLMVEGEELRIERFKVKTINVAGVGVVKEEQK